jgi:hypothetical protein
MESYCPETIHSPVDIVNAIASSDNELSYEVIYEHVMGKYQAEGLQIAKFIILQAHLRSLVNNRRLTATESSNLMIALKRLEIKICADQREAFLVSYVESINSSSSGIASRRNLLKVCILMAYSDDYPIGHICQKVNQEYAESKGYSFDCRVRSHDEILQTIAPKTHATWYKVHLINEYLSRIENELQYIVWIDSDAVVVNQDIRIEDILARAGYRELILAEDMNICCLVNAGVMIIRCCEWSRALWADVWGSKNYDGVAFYEQSALTKSLKARREGFKLYDPFHTYLPGANQEERLLAHVCVLPHVDLNSHIGWSNLSKLTQRNLITQSTALLLSSETSASDDVGSDADIDEVEVGGDSSQRCPNFIFHPAGLRQKKEAILYMLQKYRKLT